MTDGHHTYAIIPARSGSKEIIGKNIRPIAGFPLVAFSIAAAKLTSNIDRVIVSTDSDVIADVALRYGAEVPFLRPAQLATDNSTDREFVINALDWFLKNERHEPDLLVHLRPTTPLRDPAKISEALDKFSQEPNASSLRSAHSISQPPQKMFNVDGKYFVGLFPNDLRDEYYNLPRQSFPHAYDPNGYVDILRTSFVRSGKALHGSQMLAFVTDPVQDLDSLFQLRALEERVNSEGHLLIDYLKSTNIE